MQKNWIGRSVGAKVTFKIKGTDKSFDVFTTRVDTLYGCSYCVLAPEHPLVKELVSKEQKAAVEAYLKEVESKSDLERTELNKDKTGVFLGVYAINPVNGVEVPIFIGDYVLASYGTGAVMAVPAHDQRDYEFAKKYNLPIKQVLEGDISEAAFVEDAPHINSDIANGLNIEKAKEVILDKLIKEGSGEKQVNYNIKDNGDLVPLKDYDLPLVLPEMKEYKPSGTGESPLANAKEWLSVTLPSGEHGTRETNTMPQWAGSCWYYIRYIDPHNDKCIGDKKLLDHWLPVDLYIGGAEHAVLHLLYARFWHKFLYDKGVVSSKEPFKKLFHQGMILGSNGEKMSKSRGNVVNPDDVVANYGADSLRLYEMFMGPLEASLPWSDTGLDGAKRYLDRVYRLFTEEENIKKFTSENDGKLDYIYNFTIKKITEDFEALRFNTAISQMMVFTNELYKAEKIYLPYLEGFLKTLACIAPHLGEELWQILGHKDLIDFEPWPSFDESKIVLSNVQIAVSVNGKLRATLDVSKDLDDETVKKLAFELEAIKRHTEGKEIKKVIVVKNKIINIVAI